MLHHVLAEADTCSCVWRVVGNGCATRPLAYGESIGDGRIVPHLSISIRVCEIYELGNLLYSSTGRDGYRGLTRRTALGGNEDDSIRTTYTEYSCG